VTSCVCVAGGRKRTMKRGVPNRLMNFDNRTRKIDSTLLPSASEAVDCYPGNISEPCGYGVDPLESSVSKQSIRYESFCANYSFQLLFSEVSNGCGSSFAQALLFLIDITYRLSHS
jgi:hypothetical protein